MVEVIRSTNPIDTLAQEIHPRAGIRRAAHENAAHHILFATCQGNPCETPNARHSLQVTVYKKRLPSAILILEEQVSTQPQVRGAINDMVHIVPTLIRHRYPKENIPSNLQDIPGLARGKWLFARA
jgi:hypothetical protein